ncbi:M1-specific T cell receptor alpha chain-like [Sebastes umbrosus]|uniref:M1-specific T cell receptor alpha chain-like n=1 Tax=Sebastes umbrosus TaxID=72105 RepID=UPI00189F7125|nr:M1-specific T cell receptor alpha chain-like [Sebastes umbrosus]
MIFGSGTKLHVNDKEEYKPSFYKLSDGETTACLATGFSHLQAANITHIDIFINTSAVRIGEDSLFNEVALLSKGDEDKCQRAEDGAASELCEDTLEPDAKVNLMSLTILGLRLLFLKTIVFNVLLTLRLWISH